MAKKAASKTAPAPAPAQEAAALEPDVKIHSINTSGNVLAYASVTLGGCFAVRGLRIVDSTKGPFVSMPGYKAKDGCRDICFPCTKEFRQQFQDTVLCAYHQELAQIHESRGCERPRSSKPEDSLWLRGAGLAPLRPRRRRLPTALRKRARPMAAWPCSRHCGLLSHFR